MKFASVSLALLGLPSALAAILYRAVPTSPDPVALAPGAVLFAQPPLQTPAPARDQVTDTLRAKLHALFHGPDQQIPSLTLDDDHDNENNENNAPKPDLKRRDVAKPSPSSTSLTIINTFTSATSGKDTKPTLPGTLSGVTTGGKTTVLPAITTTTSGAGIAVASFTAGGGTYGVTSQSGYIVIDGKTLSAGGPGALVGGADVTDASKGGLIVDGTKIPLTAPMSVSAPAMTSSASMSMSSAAAMGSGSASMSTSAAKTTMSKGDAVHAPAATGHVVALVGALVGAMIL